LEDYQALGTDGNHKSWPHVESVKKTKIRERLSSAFVKRVPQTRKLLDHSKTCKYPVIICGDFNDTPISYNYRQLTNDYWDSFTLSGNGIGGTTTIAPFLRIDYILLSDELNSFDYKTHSQELSDHRAISTMIEF